MKVREDVYQEERFEYRGYPCVILFMEMGHRCGYVGVPIAEAVDDISCHGGITYCAGHLHGQDDEGVIWYGFDCAHWMDAPDVEKTREYFGRDPYRRPFDTEVVRTLEYCKEECKKIVDQIIEMNK